MMLQKGTKVVITYPNYAIGIEGTLLRQEDKDHWLVKLEQNPLTHKKQFFLLYLAESEFVVMNS